LAVATKDSFKGIIPATVTPMKEDSLIDVDAYDYYLRWIVSQGVTGLAVNVDTGEGPTLTSDEKTTLLEIARQRLGASKTLVAGLSAGSLRAVVEEARRAQEAGAQAVLVFPNPAFRGEPQDNEALGRYYSEIAESADIDLIIFQLQDALGGIEFGEDVLSTLASVERVVGIKEATFNFSKYKRTLELFQRLEEESGRPLAFLTGNDNFLFESFLWGCDGALIGAAAQDTANIVDCYKACATGDWARAVGLAKRLQPLVDAVFAPPVRSYRARTKACLYLQGVIPSRVVRPPMVETSELELPALRDALRNAGLTVAR
jgi:4-hydroxy-tetrahydrodipicolinate synthase